MKRATFNEYENVIEIQKIHNSVDPIAVRTGDPIRSIIKINNQNFDFNVWRISPFGVELLENNKVQVNEGDSVDMSLSIGTVSTSHSGIVVTSKHKEKERNIIGIRFYQDKEQTWVGDDRRNTKRWLCSHEFLPNGVCPNPGKFNDFIFFKVLDISSAGIRIETSMRNKFLVPGMILKSTLTFPTLGNGQVMLKVENALKERVKK